MSEINFFGETSFRNIRKKFGIRIDDRRRHFYAVGKTGMGKTVMLKNMAIQDIQAGCGLGFIDPHGEAAEELLSYIPESRIKDTIYFNPSDMEYPISFNVMEDVGEENRHVVVSGLMSVFKKLWPDVWSARMEYILNYTILALLETPGSTLLGINRLMSDPEYRKMVIDNVKDPVVKAFWVQEYARYTQRYEVEATAAIQNKVGQFISNPLIRNIVGQVRSSIDMRKVMDGQQILIANLSKGKVGEDSSRLLGGLLVTKLQLAAMSRVDIPEEQRKDFFLYIDEFQNFATDSFTNILSEARKYRLALILGHQYIAQLGTGDEAKVRDAVFGNVGTLVIFRIGAEDAEFLEAEFTPEFLATDFVNLGKYNIYVKLMIDGISSRPFSAYTLPPIAKPEATFEKQIIDHSRATYGTPKKEVEEKIAVWTGAQELAQKSMPLTQPSSSSGAGPALYDAICSNCQKPTKVVFPPDGKRPVYCKSCRNKLLKSRTAQSAQPVQQQAPAVQQSAPAPAPVSVPTVTSPVPSIPVPASVSFTPRVQQERPVRQASPTPRAFPQQRKQVDKSELKKVLQEALGKQEKSPAQEPQKKEKGTMNPGDTVYFKE